jgi:NAD+ synthase (glutamine-hydrolysing)
MTRKLRIAGATVNQTPFDWIGNTQHILDAIQLARIEKIELLCFPEMSITGYGCEDVFLADWLSEKAWDELLKIKAAATGLMVCVGLPIRLNGITYNGVCVIDDTRILGITLKQNLARDGVHYEPRWFDAWPAGKTTEIIHHGERIAVGDLIYQFKGITIGFEICEDAWRTDRPGYRLLERRVELILNPSASHFALGKSELREQQVVIDGATKFNCAYLFVNLLGNEAGRMIYDGDIIIGQQGKLLAVNRRLSFKSFQLLACTIDFDHPEKSENVPSKDTKDKHEEFVRAVALGLYDYLRKSKARGFVLSLSGGADSSCCAVLVSEMVKRGVLELGQKTFGETLSLDQALNAIQLVEKLLTTVYQGTKNSSSETLRAAAGLAHSIGATFYQWTIDDEVGLSRTKIEQALGRPLTWERDDIALQNIQARSRSPVIWLLANVKQSILLTTSNRSEGDVGYATMDGDTSGSLAPLAGIDKPFLLSWLQWAEKNLGYDGLRQVNTLQPTAELRPPDKVQTDEKDLMPYTTLLEIERLAIMGRKTPASIYLDLAPHYQNKTLLKEHIRKFFRLWSANQWKRERLAPSFHLDLWNIDPRSWYRFPILSGGFENELADLDNA